MGSKHWLAKRVARLCDDKAADRPLVDLFGGMCSVAGAVAGTERPAWVNDVQSYAAAAARCLVASPVAPPERRLAESKLTPHYRKNLQELGDRFRSEIQIERRTFDAPRETYLARASQWRHAGNDAALADEVAELRNEPTRFPYRLTTLTFAWGYFGLRQSVEIDSIRYAIDSAETNGEIATFAAEWMRFALLQAASRVASAPGHFAQYLSGKSDAGHKRVIASRKRSAWDSFLEDLDRLEPFGSAEWRAGNRVFNRDALELWDEFDSVKPPVPSIFYADPPYSKDHYSRYYHVLETLNRYDYPQSHGQGRYRQDRFRTAFSIKSEVVGAVESLASSISTRDGALLLSYPSSGLLTKALDVDVGAMLSNFFSSVQLVIEADATHSTLGARHGSSRQNVVEYVWLAE